MREIVEYGRKRGVRVLPEMDVPGHEASWCAGVPDACPSTTCHEPLDPSSETTWKLISEVLGEWSGKAKGQGIFTDAALAYLDYSILCHGKPFELCPLLTCQCHYIPSAFS